jgi:hypothetical protein
MFCSETCAAIKANYDRVGTAHLPRDYALPPETSLGRGEALFPPSESRATIAAAVEAQCRVFCRGPLPVRDEVMRCRVDRKAFRSFS